MSSIEVSFVIASKCPKELCKFYSQLIDCETSEGLTPTHFVLVTKCGIKLQFYKPSSKNTFLPKGRSTSVCFKKTSFIDPLITIQKWVKNVEALGGMVIEPPRLDIFGAEVIMSDPDGNSFILLVSA